MTPRARRLRFPSEAPDGARPPMREMGAHAYARLIHNAMVRCVCKQNSEVAEAAGQRRHMATKKKTCCCCQRSAARVRAGAVHH